MHADVETTLNEVIGLRLPDGTEIFPPQTWHGRGLTTAEDRKTVLDAIAQSAVNLGIQTHELLSQYGWLVRGYQTIMLTVPLDTTEVPLDDPSLTTPAPAPPDPVNLDDTPEEPILFSETLPPSV